MAKRNIKSYNGIIKMDVKDIKNIFLRFLKDNNVYDKYVYNFSQDVQSKWRESKKILINSKSLNLWIEQNLINSNNKKITELISSAFLWCHTSEWATFWADIDIKWKREIKYYM